MKFSSLLGGDSSLAERWGRRRTPRCSLLVIRAAALLRTSSTVVTEVVTADGPRRSHKRSCRERPNYRSRPVALTAPRPSARYKTQHAPRCAPVANRATDTASLGVSRLARLRYRRVHRGARGEARRNRSRRLTRCTTGPVETHRVVERCARCDAGARGHQGRRLGPTVRGPACQCTPMRSSRVISPATGLRARAPLARRA